MEMFDSLGYRLRLAFELEFYLVDKKLDIRGKPRFPGMRGEDGGEMQTQVYSLSDLDQRHEFLTGVQDLSLIHISEPTRPY